MRISDWSSDVCSSDLQLAGDQMQIAQLQLFFGLQRQRARRLATVEMRLHALQQLVFGECFLVAGFGGLGEALGGLGDAVEIGKAEFSVDDLDVSDRVRAAGKVNDVWIVEAGRDVRERGRK